MSDESESVDATDDPRPSDADGAEPADGAETREPASSDASETTTGAEDDAEDLAARVAAHDEGLAEEVRELGERVEALESELSAAEETLDERDERIDELESMLKRKQADFQNYKKRAKKRQEQLKERATEDFVERIVTVRDNLVRALEQDEETDIRGGVETTLEEFDRVLDEEDVGVIAPDPGAEVDPQRHEVMMRVESDQPEGTVADVYQHGYEMGDRVIRAAQITVSSDEDE